MKNELNYSLVRAETIEQSIIRRLFLLMEIHYDEMTFEQFQIDLKRKDFVGLIKDENNTVQGFTTYVVNPKGTGTTEYNVVFSGDTIIAKEHWGSQIMMQGWCNTIGRLMSTDVEKKWYWYLLSKGHRTYMYLPLFFKHYYPALVPLEYHEEMAAIANAVSSKLFGADWKPAEGVLRFSKSLGQLKPDLAADTRNKTSSKWVNFFLERNPGFDKGEELVCVAKLEIEHVLRSSKKLIQEGIDQGFTLLMVND